MLAAVLANFPTLKQTIIPEAIAVTLIIKSKSSQSIEKTGAFEEMDLRVDCLPQIISKQYGQVCSSSSSTIDSQKNYMHRLEINDDGIYQSSFAFCDRNGPLLKSSVTFADKEQKYQSHVWIALMCLLILWGLMLIIVGTVNIPFCPSRPMIPIFLIVMGCFYILWALLRIYAFWPRSHADALSIDLTCKALEGTLIVAIVVWLFLGNFL
uniref:Uncharacterized protein n=1 Tax=Setaria digitata TaxID=48799 RepID=A0A915PKF2_9BILA